MNRPTSNIFPGLVWNSTTGKWELPAQDQNTPLTNADLEAVIARVTANQLQIINEINQNEKKVESLATRQELLISLVTQLLNK